MTGGLVLRVAELDVFLGLLAARDQADYGEQDLSRVLILDIWRARSFVAETNAIIAVQDEQPVGAALVVPEGALSFVIPESEGRGVGTRLLAWSEQRALALGSACHRQRIARTNESARAFLSEAGYTGVRSVHHMWMALAQERTPQPPPDPVTLVPLDVDRDAAALADADARMFAGNADYTPMSAADFYDTHLSSPELDPALSLVACHNDTTVGFALCRRWSPECGFVDLLAVDPSQRGRGLGTALLHGAMSAFARAGLREARLDVASDNPTAMRIYERAGMVMRHETLVLEKPA